MSGPEGSGSLTARVWQAALVVLMTAVFARVAWEILKPLVPGLFIFVVLIGIYSFMFRGRR